MRVPWLSAEAKDATSTQMNKTLKPTNNNLMLAWADIDVAGGEYVVVVATTVVVADAAAAAAIADLDLGRLDNMILAQCACRTPD